MKKTFYSELAYVFAIVFLTLGTALMEAADFGVSMVVAPAYLAHLKLAEIGAGSFFSFGTCVYLWQLLLLILGSLVLRRFRLSFLFSFVTALIYGTVLDGMVALVGLLPFAGMAARFVYYVIGLFSCAVGVSLMFHTYISPEVYELLVKEISAKFGWKITKVKTAYDCCSCLLGVVLSFAFFGFGHFEGVKWGTIVCALVNGFIIGQCSKFFDKRWNFPDGLKLRRLFQ